MKYLFGMALLLCLVPLVSCQTAGTSEIVHSAKDHELAGEVHRNLRDGLVLDGSRIGVTVQDGIVTLHGAVRDRAVKARATSIAENVPGVVKVNNNLSL